MHKQKTNLILLSIVALSMIASSAYADTTQETLPPVVDTNTVTSTQQTIQTQNQTQQTSKSQNSTQETSETQTTTETEQYTPPTAPFPDITSGDPNFLAIAYLKQIGLVQGYDDGTFKAGQAINRAEALKILLAGIKGVNTVNNTAFNFPDVSVSDWFYTAVKQAWNNYLVQGYPDKSFHPEKTINLAEAVKMLILQEADQIPQISDKPYNDVETTDWFAPYAKVAKDKTLVLEERKTGNFNGGSTLNRGSFSDLIYRALKSAEGYMFARASWYADFSSKVKITASGAPLDNTKFTAAHKTLPFGTKLLVTSLSSGKQVEVVINDRGPYVTGVDLDLSKSAFEALAPAGAGIVTVEYKIEQ